MEVIRDIESIPPLQNTIVTTGTFDGVHRGHQKIFEEMKILSAETGKQTIVVTFHPHPRIVLKKAPEKLHLLAVLDEKIKRIENTGVDYLVILKFDYELASLTPEKFVCNILIRKLGADVVFVGYDHQFGKKKSGNIETLKQVSCRNYIDVKEVNALKENDEIISSTNIRHHIENGAIEKANNLLGYRYQITGKVVKGNKLGRKIGFPTANIEPADKLKLIPMQGVYAVRAFIAGTWHNGMINIGNRPTLNTAKATVEVHVFDLNANLYEQEITVEFIRFLREEKKFSGLDELGNQLTKDKENAREILYNLN
ncbi:MAG: bifunctional riboflavin kinase/FAD synthetase [Bacteroidota bacterium]